LILFRFSGIFEGRWCDARTRLSVEEYTVRNEKEDEEEGRVERKREGWRGSGKGEKRDKKREREREREDVIRMGSVMEGRRGRGGREGRRYKRSVWVE
jgi:hypothetical protein